MSSTDISNILKQLDELSQPRQLPALFKPHNISPVLGSPEKKNPMSGYFVGGEGAEPDAEPVWYAIRHRETGRTLSSHKDEAAARDEMAGLGDQRQEYKLVKTSRRPNQFGLDEEDSGGQQYAVTIDAIDHGVLSPITVTASSPAEAKQKAIASATASMAKRGYELQVRSAGVKSAQGVAEATGDKPFDKMMGKITGGAGARQGVDSLNKSLTARTGSNPETALAKWGQEFIKWLEDICRNFAKQGADRISKLENLGNLDDGGETMAHWLIEVAKKTNTSGITLADIQEFSSEFNTHGMWAWQHFPIAWSQSEWQDYKDQWTGPDGYIASLGQGVAEGSITPDVTVNKISDDGNEKEWHIFRGKEMIGYVIKNQPEFADGLYIAHGHGPGRAFDKEFTGLKPAVNYITSLKGGIAEGSSSLDEYERRLASIQSLRYDDPPKYAIAYRKLITDMPNEHYLYATNVQKGSYSSGERGAGTGRIGGVAEEASPMITPPSNRFDSKQEAFAHAKAHGGKVFKSTYTDPNTGNKNVSFVVKKDQDVEEGWKQKLGAAALAGSMAMGASARVVPGQDEPGVNRLTGKPNVSQVVPDVPEQPILKGFSTSYLQKAADPNRFGRFLISVEDAKAEVDRRAAAYELRSQGDQKTNEQGVAEGSGDVNSKERYHFLYPHVPLDMHTDHEYNNLSDRDLQAVKSHQRELADKLGKPGAKKQGDIASHIQINRARSQYDQEQAHRRKVLDAEKIKRQARDAKRQQGVAEVAPPGAEAERMVKHIKQGYARDGKLTGKEKAIAYATTWKAHNQGQVEEASADLVGFHLDTERAYNAVMERFGDVVEQDQESGMMTVPRRYWPQLEQVAYDADGIGAIEAGGEKIAVDEVEESYWQPQIDEAIAQEDVLDKEKRHLGDYLQSVADAVKHDAALSSKDTPTHSGDTIGSAVKTVTTDDGHDLKIHGNEDDGFRISIKGRPSRVKFKSLDEAGMACEMYRSHRRHKLESADYIEEQ
jgi:hypothetical protein